MSTSVNAEIDLQSILLSIAELAPVATVAQRLAEAALRLTGADYAALGAYDAESQLRNFEAAGMTPEERARLPHPPRGIGLLGEFGRGAGTIVTPDVRANSKAAGFPEGHPEMQAFLGVPVRSGGETVGAFYVAKRPGGTPFEQADRVVLERLAPYAAIALANALTLERERARTAVAEMLVTTAKTQQQASDEQETMEALIAALASAAPEAISIAVRWMSPDGDDHRYAAQDGSEALTAALRELPDEEFAEGSRELRDLLPELRVTLHVARLPGDGCLALAATSRASLGEIGREAMRSLVELGVIGVAATRRREAEAALERYEERDAIARDLHDDLIQSIYAVGLSLRAALSAQPEEIRRALSKGVDDLSAVIRDLRSYIAQLSAAPHSVSSPEMLAMRIRALLAGISRPTWDIDVDFGGGRLARQLERQLYMIVREAVSNVVRHADAHTASLALRRDGDRLRLEVSDDGVGFDRNAVPVDSVGLRSIERRVADLGGSVVIESARGHGTSIVATFEIREGDDD